MKTKYTIHVLLIFLVTAFTLSAQNLTYEVGHISTQYKGMLPFTQYKGGFQLGVGYAIPVRDSTLYFKTGLHYQHLDGMGTVNHFNQVNQVVLSYEKNQELYYLNIPVLLQYQTQLYKKISIGLLVGVTGNYLLRAWHNPQRINLDHNVTSGFQRFVLGYQTGAFTQVKLSPISRLQLSYQFGSNITSVQKQVGETGFNTHAILLGLVYDFKQLNLLK